MDKKVAGWSRINGKLKPVFNPRVIKRGRRKGMIEVTYLAGFSGVEKIYRKAIVGEVRD